MASSSYDLIDSGNGTKLERFGPYVLSRPCAQALWHPKQSSTVWEAAHGTFSRERGAGWRFACPMPKSWTISIEGMVMRIQPTDFGHLGIFPEQRPCWTMIRKLVHPAARVLNLFAYSGGSSIAAALSNASVCHLDASKGMVQWARENAALNGLSSAPIRWICEDVMKFLKREIRRSSQYDAIILDPPSFGRGSKGEVFTIEENIIDLLTLCRSSLSTRPLFLLFSCHTPTFSPLTMRYLLQDACEGLGGSIESGEMTLSSEGGMARPIPSGTYAIWRADASD